MPSRKFAMMLVCPQTSQRLVPLQEAVLKRMNRLVLEGKLYNRGGEQVSELLVGGLVTEEDESYLYPIYEKIPVLISSEAIDLRMVGTGE